MNDGYKRVENDPRLEFHPFPEQSQAITAIEWLMEAPSASGKTTAIAIATLRMITRTPGKTVEIWTHHGVSRPHAYATADAIEYWWSNLDLGSLGLELVLSRRNLTAKCVTKPKK